MKLIILLALAGLGFQQAHAQFSVRYDPSAQPTTNIQYFKPLGDLFVGDCIPFYHNKTYYLYWLLDSAHHSALNGLGGHQWVLSTSRDLINWKHHPIVLGIDEEWEKSICTGSVVYANNQFYAFYATRLVNAQGQVNEQLSYAISKDGIHFKKQKPNPFYTSAPGYSPRNFRDPKVIVDTAGQFHLFVSSATQSAMNRYDGAMVHLVSKDLKKWNVKSPLLQNQDDVPECPDYFYWKGWYYLVYGKGSNTFYLKSREAYGPWEHPSNQALNEDWLNVVKTAEFTNGRRIAAGWVPGRKDNQDNGHEIFGGSLAFREVMQLQDGSLATRFPQELIPPTGKPLTITPATDSLTIKIDSSTFKIQSPNGMGSFYLDNIPLNTRITLQVEPLGDLDEYGLILRSDQRAEKGYKLGLSPNDRTARLHNTEIRAVNGLNNTLSLDIVLKNDIIDVCIGNQRCLVNRLPGQKGERLWFYVKHGSAIFRNIAVAPFAEQDF